MTLTVTDLFCGAGGSSLGAEMVPGVQLAMGVNHWAKAIEVHQQGFPHARHDCADLSAVDFRRYPPTDILLASPECTNHSASKGVSRRRQDRNLFDIEDPSAVRSRATMWDVHRYIETHRPAAVVVENVVDARSWVYWPSWWQAFADARYTARVLSINSMHAGPVPQSRDRIYVVAIRDGLKVDLDLTPEAWCPTCQTVVLSRQTFKRLDRPWGRYRRQYEYRCPTCRIVVTPPAMAAAEAIDWTLPSTPIGARTRPLAAATLRRIRIGLERYGFTVQHGVAWPPPFIDTQRRHNIPRPVTEPNTTMVAGSTTHALICPPFLLSQYDYAGGDDKRVRSIDQPAPTVVANGNHHFLVQPPTSGLIVQAAHSGDDSCRVRTTDQPWPTQTASDDRQLLVQVGAWYVKNYGPGDDPTMTHPVTDPLGTVTTQDHHALLVPYYRTGYATPVQQPSPTLTTKDRNALLEIAVDLDDCLFRMFEPHEVGAAMAFPTTYKVEGTKKDVVRLYGNAVTPPTMAWIVGRVAQALAA